MQNQADYLTSREAIRRLGVKPQTLYAYVSRGWIRNVPAGKRGRKLYLRADVERVKARADSRAGHAAVAAAALRWGEPVMSSSVTGITASGPRYRGFLATDLARQGVSFEAVAELLWNARRESQALREHHCGRRWIAEAEIRRLARIVSNVGRGPFENPAHLFAFVALLAGDETLKDTSDRDEILRSARRIVAALVTCLGYLPQLPSPAIFDEPSIAATVSAALGAPKSADAVKALNACLVLCADHELSPTTFVARIAASTAAGLGSCISAAILAQPQPGDPRSPGGTEDFLLRLAAENDVHRALERERLEHRNPPGFNHPLYPNGDPRGRTLIGIAQDLNHQTRSSEALYRLFEIATSEFRFLPTLEAGLAAVRAALALPRGSTAGLFLAGRSVGWIAHTLEQWNVDVPLRPRARYVEDTSCTGMARRRSRELVAEADNAPAGFFE